MQDQKQFTALLLASKGAIFKIIINKLEDNAYHDDIYQEVCERAWQAYSSFREESKFCTWICQITKYTIIDKLRRWKADAARIAEYNVFYEITTSESETPYEEPYTPVIDCLSEAEKRTLQMRIDGLSFDEISKIMGEPENRLRVRMYRIKQTLSTAIRNNS